MTDDVEFRERVLAFELQTGGSHPSYVRNFANLWQQARIPATLRFVVSQKFRDQHADVWNFVDQQLASHIDIQSLSDAEESLVTKETVAREFRGWKLCCKYARNFNATRSILMYSDRFQLPMLLGERSPCPVSCIYFRPTFHYRSFNNYRPTLAMQLAATRKRWMLGRLLKLRQLDVLFCLDPLAAEFIQSQTHGNARIRVLPDSFVQPEIGVEDVAALRTQLGIETGRRVLMLLGILDARKGAAELLRAALALPIEEQRQLCLLLIGQIHAATRDEVLSLIEQLKKRGAAQVVFNDAYVSDTIVQTYYEVADVALTTYQRHMGMSSALIRAALARIPVLSSDYGLMGELVQRHHLGQVVDTESSDQFTKALRQAIVTEPNAQFDADSAAAFARQHSPEALGQALREWIAP